MIYISFYFYLFVAVLLGIYYTMPLRYRWICLLLGSLAFYYRLSQKGFGIFAVTLLLSYFMGIFLEYMQETEKNPHVKKWIPVAFALLISLPLILTKHGDFVLKSLLHKASYPWVVPLGLSFYTMQTIAYLVDISKGKIKAQKNPGKYILFVCFFPQIVQGPIPRYQELSATLYEGHPFNEREFCRAFHALWHVDCLEPLDFL